MKHFIIATFILLGASACQPSAKKITEIVETKNGAIEGIDQSETGLHIFKGIPFAQPPVGELRWKAPQPVENWEGIKPCKEFSAIPIQRDPAPFSMWTSEFIAPAGNMSEDCLYLNVWTPAKTTADKLPVWVYIYGGGFNSGSSSVPLYDGENMAKKGIIFITINYRVNVFGFFSHPELTAQSPNHSSGNQGLLDQVAALQWVHDNIEAFGGDRGNVTISGQSAGAFSVGYLVASPLAQGLFQKAVAESGGAIASNRSRNGTYLEIAEKIGIEFQEKLNSKSLAELQAIDASEIMKIGTIARPIVDGYFLPKSVQEIYANGEQNDVPIITGWNEDEGLGGQPQPMQKFIESAKQNYGALADEFLKVFPANTEEEAFASQTTLGNLMTFGIQTYEWMLQQNKTGKADVYVYYFTRDVPYGEGQQNFGAFHSGELGYAYNNLDQSKVRPWTDGDRKLADQMSTYWVNFAKTGNPNGEGLPTWNPCKSENDKALNFDLEIKEIDFPNLEQLKVLKEINSQK